MARSDFVEHHFTCSVCRAKFAALVGRQQALPPDPVCNDCGLRYSAEKMRKLIHERKASRC